MTLFAYCYRSGQIEFGTEVPDGAIALGSGGNTFREHVEIRARRAYDGKTLLVPGLPEATTDDDALLAVRLFIKWAIKGRNLTRSERVAARAAQMRSLRGVEGHVIVDEFSSIDKALANAEGRS